MKYWPLALCLGLTAAAAFSEWRKRQPSDFTHVDKLARFKEYTAEVNEESRRRLALTADRRRSA